MPAADVGDVRAGGELGFDTVERGDPGAGQVVEVAGPEEPFAAAEDVLVVVAPREPAAGPEPLGDRVGGVDRADGDLERADHAGRAGLIGERDGVLVGQQEPAGAVVEQVAACRLGARPLAHVPLGGAGAAGQFRRGERPGTGHRPVQPELVADHDHRTAEQRSDIADRLLDECGHLRLVHVLVPFRLVHVAWCG